MPPPPAPAPHGGGEAASDDDHHQARQPQHQQRQGAQTQTAATTTPATARATPVADSGDGAAPTAAPQPLLTLSVLPRRHVKTLHLVRHAEGFHNVAGAVDYAAYKLERFLDAHLTSEGWRQARALQAAIAGGGTGEPGEPGGGGNGGAGGGACGRPPRPEVVLVSPMARALETAAAVFGGALLEGEDDDDERGGQEGRANGSGAGGGSGGGNTLRPRLLMRRQAGEPSVREAHPAVSAAGAPPFAAVEAARERLGVHPCDRRRPLSEKRRAFPGVDWDAHALTEKDELWRADERETEGEIRERAMRLLRLAVGRRETELAVVSHSSLLWHLLAAAATDEGVRRPFANAELRTVVLVVSP